MCKGTLIAVKNMEESKNFYHDLLGMRVLSDFGANVQLEGGLFLQTLDTWSGLIKTQEICLKNHAAELYFEVPDLTAFCKKLSAAPVEYVHGPIEHRWGQRAVRFYDPNHHVIEVAEELAMVVKRFSAGGMTAEQVAARMEIAVKEVRAYLEG